MELLTVFWQPLRKNQIATELGDGMILIKDENTGEPIGIEGRQRGWSKQKDQYIFAEIGLSFSLTSYRCPTAK